MTIAAGIEKNRTALLGFITSWLLIASCLNALGSRPLPRRVAIWVAELVCDAEKAAGFLLIAACYNMQVAPRRHEEIEKSAALLAALSGCITQHTLTLDTLKQRLQAIRHILRNLHKSAGQLGLKLAFCAFVENLKSTTMADMAQQMSLQSPCSRWPSTARHAVPP